MRTFLATILAAGLVAAPVRAQDVLIDRVLATVEGHVITLSDVRAVRALGLVPSGTADAGADAVLDALIDRVLVLAEVDRYMPPEPDAATIARGVAAIRAAHPGSYESALDTAGLDEAFVRLWVRSELRIEGYLAQRFAGVVEPGEEDFEAYRRAHAAEGRPLDDAAVRAAVTAERRAALVREWIAGLRARATITRAPAL
jgi:hypothetical protein